MTDYAAGCEGMSMLVDSCHIPQPERSMDCEDARSPGGTLRFDTGDAACCVRVLCWRALKNKKKRKKQQYVWNAVTRAPGDTEGVPVMEEESVLVYHLDAAAEAFSTERLTQIVTQYSDAELIVLLNPTGASPPLAAVAPLDDPDVETDVVLCAEADWRAMVGAVPDARAVVLEAASPPCILSNSTTVPQRIAQPLSTSSERQTIVLPVGGGNETAEEEVSAEQAVSFLVRFAKGMMSLEELPRLFVDTAAVTRIDWDAVGAALVADERWRMTRIALLSAPTKRVMTDALRRWIMTTSLVTIGVWLQFEKAGAKDFAESILTRWMSETSSTAWDEEKDLEADLCMTSALTSASAGLGGVQDAFSRRWEGRPFFPLCLRHCNDAFIQQLPEGVLRRLLPARWSGLSSVTKFSESGDDAEDACVRRIANLVAEGAEPSSGAVPEVLVKSDNRRARAFALTFVVSAFRQLGVEKLVCCGGDAVNYLMGVAPFTAGSVVSQCVALWWSGQLASEGVPPPTYKVEELRLRDMVWLVTSPPTASQRLQELRAALSETSPLDFAACEARWRDLEGQFRDVAALQRLLSYAPGGVAVEAEKWLELEGRLLGSDDWRQREVLQDVSVGELERGLRRVREVLDGVPMDVRRLARIDAGEPRSHMVSLFVGEQLGGVSSVSCAAELWTGYTNAVRQLKNVLDCLVDGSLTWGALDRMAAVTRTGSVGVEALVKEMSVVCALLERPGDVAEVVRVLGAAVEQAEEVHSLVQFVADDGGFDWSRCETLRQRISELAARDLSGMTVADLARVAQEVGGDFGGASLTSVARLCVVLANHKRMENMCRFFQQDSSARFVDVKGTLTEYFHDTLREHQEKVRGWRSDLVSRFGGYSEFVVAVMYSRGCGSLKEAMSVLRRHVERGTPPKPMSLKAWEQYVTGLYGVNDEMNEVTDIFTRKQDPLMDVVECCTAACEHGYVFGYDLLREEVRLVVLRDRIVVSLCHADVVTFLHRLRFVCHHNADHFSEPDTAKKLLERVSSYYDSLGELRRLHKACHPDFNSTAVYVTRAGTTPSVDRRSCESVLVKEGFTQVPAAYHDMNKTLLGAARTQWMEKVTRLSTAAWLPLLSIGAVREAAECASSGGVLEALVGHFMDPNATAAVAGDMLVKDGEDWLTYFLRVVAPSPSLRLPPPPCRHQRNSCATAFVEASPWCALEVVYSGGSAPFPFEVLFCESNTDDGVVDTLLSNSVGYPQYDFTLVHCNRLPTHLQRRLVEHIMEHPDQHNISFVMEEQCALQSVAHRLKAGVAANAVSLPSDVTIRCFCGPSGSGKTYQLQKAVRKATAAEGDGQRAGVCWLVVTEGFRISDAVSRLKDSVGHERGGPTRLLVVLQLSVGRFFEWEEEKWCALCRQVNLLLYQLIRMRCVMDSSSGRLAVVPPSTLLEVLVEVPSTADVRLGSGDGGGSGVAASDLTAFPLLGVVNEDSVVQCSEMPFGVDGPAARTLAQYLKAMESGAIDCLDTSRDSKDVMFLMDVSGSMAGGRIKKCSECLLGLLATLDDGDRFGLTIYNDKSDEVCSLQAKCDEAVYSVTQALRVAKCDRGSSMWLAINDALKRLDEGGSEGGQRERFLLVLSDGSCDNVCYSQCKEKLKETEGRIHVVFLALEVEDVFYSMISRELGKQRRIIRFDENGVEGAFADAAERLRVTERIERDAGELSGDAVDTIIMTALRGQTAKAKVKWSRGQQAMWVRYMCQRVGLLRRSGKFDLNVSMAQFGRTTMELMVQEASHAVGQVHTVWEERTHEHVVYRYKEVGEGDSRRIEPEWSVLRVNADKRESGGWGERKQVLKSLEMYVPSAEDLKEDRVLESYLAVAIGADLDSPERVRSSTGEFFDFPLGRLPALSELRFVLTTDYLLKMLLINERVNCRCPCILMGETGVSKTKVTQVLFQLKHSRSRTSELHDIVRMRTYPGEEAKLLEQLCSWLNISTVDCFLEATTDTKDTKPLSFEHAMRSRADLASRTAVAVLEVLREDPFLDPLSCPALQKADFCRLSDPVVLSTIVEWLMTSSGLEEERREWMFRCVNVNAAMTAAEIREKTRRMKERAERLEVMGGFDGFHHHKAAQICLFFDEFNTTSCMGVLKEILQDHTLDGERLPENLVVIAACNPYRGRLSERSREAEYGEDWLTGHYNVRPLPLRLAEAAWDYGSLRQEDEFIEKRLTMVPDLSSSVAESVRTILSAAMEATRKLAEEALPSGARQDGRPLENHLSAVSLRDILRFFRMMEFLRAEKAVRGLLLLGEHASESKVDESAVALAAAIVFYVRFSESIIPERNSRRKFAQILQDATRVDVEASLEHCITAVMREVVLSAGNFDTASLRENVTILLLSVLSKTPLIMKGPPGSSKTLSVRVLCENARGVYSKRPFFRGLPALEPQYYQCSRQSTSNEIREVFELALQRQETSDKLKGRSTIHFVFMDEAGLPEEERESLKVLHYYLDANGHGGVEIGFVAITNELLDAANMNRCNLLCRPRCPVGDLEVLARGYLQLPWIATVRPPPLISTTITRRGELLTADDVIERLCCHYYAQSADDSARPTLQQPGGVSTLYVGLRDLVHCFKTLGARIERGGGKPMTLEDVVVALQRNISGAGTTVECRAVVKSFINALECDAERSPSVPNFVSMVLSSLQVAEDPARKAPDSRPLLVVDTTNCGAISRELLRLSRFHLVTVISVVSGGNSSEEMRALGDIAWHAAQGSMVGLVNTSSILESLYDLFNQQYTLIQRDSNLCRTRIAIGSMSVVCDISPRFQCVVFLTEPELEVCPSAFLDRMEKYRLQPGEILRHYVMERDRSAGTDARPWNFVRQLVRPLQRYGLSQIRRLARALYGVTAGTLGTVLLVVLRKWEVVETVLGCLSADGGGIVTEDTLCEGHLPRLRAAAERELMRMLLDVAIPERILPLLSADQRREYLCGLPSSTWMRELVEANRKYLIITRSVCPNFCESVVPAELLVESVKCVTDADFERGLEDAWSMGVEGSVVVVLDLRHVTFDQVNGVRRMVDALHLRKPRSAMVVLQLTSVNVTYCYDTMLADDWDTKFVDSLGDSSLPYWLRMVYRDGSEEADMSADDQACFLSSLADGLTGAVFVTHHSFADSKLTPVPADRIRQILEMRLKDVCIGDLIMQRFAKKWKLSGSLRDVLREILTDLSNDPCPLSLLKVIHMEVSRALESTLVECVCHVLQYLGAGGSGVELSEEAAQLLADGVAQSLSDSYGAVPAIVAVPYVGGFPFYAEMSDTLRKCAVAANCQSTSNIRDGEIDFKWIYNAAMGRYIQMAVGCPILEVMSNVVFSAKRSTSDSLVEAYAINLVADSFGPSRDADDIKRGATYLLEQADGACPIVRMHLRMIDEMFMQRLTDVVTNPRMSSHVSVRSIQALNQHANSMLTKLQSAVKSSDVAAIQEVYERSNCLLRRGDPVVCVSAQETFLTRLLSVYVTWTVMCVGSLRLDGERIMQEDVLACLKDLMNCAGASWTVSEDQFAALLAKHAGRFHSELILSHLAFDNHRIWIWLRDYYLSSESLTWSRGVPLVAGVGLLRVLRSSPLGSFRSFATVLQASRGVLEGMLFRCAWPECVAWPPEPVGAVGMCDAVFAVVWGCAVVYHAASSVGEIEEEEKRVCQTLDTKVMVPVARSVLGRLKAEVSRRRSPVPMFQAARDIFRNEMKDLYLLWDMWTVPVLASLYESISVRSRTFGLRRAVYNVLQPEERLQWRLLERVWPTVKERCSLDLPDFPPTGTAIREVVSVRNTDGSVALGVLHNAIQCMCDAVLRMAADRKHATIPVISSLHQLSDLLGVGPVDLVLDAEANWKASEYRLELVSEVSCTLRAHYDGSRWSLEDEAATRRGLEVITSQRLVALPPNLVSELCRRVCYDDNDVRGGTSDAAHSLNFYQLHYLQALLSRVSKLDSSVTVDFLRDLPAKPPLLIPQDTWNYICSFTVTDLHTLLCSLRHLCKLKSYIFYDFPLRLKTELPEDLSGKLQGELESLSAAAARRLSAKLLQRRGEVERGSLDGALSKSRQDCLAPLLMRRGTAPGEVTVLRRLEKIGVLHSKYYTALIRTLFDYSCVGEGGGDVLTGAVPAASTSDLGDYSFLVPAAVDEAESDATLVPPGQESIFSWRSSTARDRGTQPSNIAVVPLSPVSNDELLWRSAKGGAACTAGDELMRMVGLSEVKQFVRDLAAGWRAHTLTTEVRHFLFLGPHGTGKSTVARLLGRVLNDFGVCSSFSETSGEQLLLGGYAKAEQLFRESRGAVLLIDDVDGLKTTTAEGGSIVKALVRAMKRIDDGGAGATVLLTGLEDAVEKALLSTDSSLHSLISHSFKFKNFTEEELRSVFVSLCRKSRWDVQTTAADVAARRLSRGRLSRAFGNATAARHMFTTACDRAAWRDDQERVITPVDVVGAPITRESSAELDQVLVDVDAMVGMASVKRVMHNFVAEAASNYEKEMRGEPVDPIVLNRVFLGNPGTGKTTMARLYGRLLKALGYLSNGDSRLVTPSDLIGPHIGQSEQRTKAIIDSCAGKVLVIDEAYSLNRRNTYGPQVLDTLVSLVDGSPGSDISVVLVGYREEMGKMLREANPGLARRFQMEHALHFEDYQDSELKAFVRIQLEHRKLSASDDVMTEIVRQLAEQRRAGNFGNMGSVSTLVSHSVVALRTRDPTSKELTLSDVTPLTKKDAPTIREIFQHLSNVDSLIKKFEREEAIMQGAIRAGRPVSEFVKNYLFLGPPGTGKTTVAKLMARVLCRVGAIEQDRVSVYSALDLQGSYVGQTKDKVNDMMAEARGGVLFIDEAYGLGRGAFGEEAVTQLLAQMTSPAHDKRTVVILAGYESELRSMLSCNEGMRSRWTGEILFPAWSTTDCMKYFHCRLESIGLKLEDDAVTLLTELMDYLITCDGWASARDCETTFRLLEEELLLHEGSGRNVTGRDVSAVRQHWETIRPGS